MVYFETVIKPALVDAMQQDISTAELLEHLRIQMLLAVPYDKPQVSAGPIENRLWSPDEKKRFAEAMDKFFATSVKSPETMAGFDTDQEALTFHKLRSDPSLLPIVGYRNKDKPEETISLEDWDHIDPTWHWMYEPVREGQI